MGHSCCLTEGKMTRCLFNLSLVVGNHHCWTPFGRIRWLQMPFRISLGPPQNGSNDQPLFWMTHKYSCNPKQHHNLWVQWKWRRSWEKPWCCFYCTPRNVLQRRNKAQSWQRQLQKNLCQLHGAHLLSKAMLKLRKNVLLSSSLQNDLDNISLARRKSKHSLTTSY